MAKRVRLSDDDGSTWSTLPGNTASISNEAGEIDDTIFGQNFASTQTGLIGWTVSANGLYKGFAGYVAKLLKIGMATSMTGEATTLVSGKTYQITATTKRIWDRSSIVVKDNAVTVDAADIESIDYLFGRVTFASGYTVTSPVTIDGNYYPTAVVGCANQFTLTQTANANDNTCMDTAQANSGHRTFEYGLKTVQLELTGIYKVANGWRDLLVNRTELIIEINPDGNSKSVARGFFKVVNEDQSGDVGAIEQESATFNLAVPDDDLLETPFKWVFANDSTLNTSLQIAINAWQANTTIDIAYLPDGSTGIQGDCVVTDVTLSGGLEVMNEFTVNVQGSGALAAYP